MSELEMARADAAIWKDQAEKLREARNLWRDAGIGMLTLGVASGALLGWAIAQVYP